MLSSHVGFLEGCYAITSFLLHAEQTSYQQIAAKEDGVFDAQFIPSSTDFKVLKATYSRYPMANKNVQILSFDKKGTESIVDLVVDDSGTLTLPQLYYTGYQVVSTSSDGITAHRFRGENGLLSVRLQGQGKSRIVMSFVEPLILRASELVSLSAVIVMVILYVRRKRSVVKRSINRTRLLIEKLGWFKLN